MWRCLLHRLEDLRYWNKGGGGVVSEGLPCETSCQKEPLLRRPSSRVKPFFEGVFSIVDFNLMNVIFFQQNPNSDQQVLILYKFSLTNSSLVLVWRAAVRRNRMVRLVSVLFAVWPRIRCYPWSVLNSHRIKACSALEVSVCGKILRRAQKKVGLVVKNNEDEVGIHKQQKKNWLKLDCNRMKDSTIFTFQWKPRIIAADCHTGALERLRGNSISADGQTHSRLFIYNTIYIYNNILV